MRRIFKTTLFLAGLLFASCQKDALNDGELSYIFTPSGLAASLSPTASASGMVVAPLSDGSITWTSGTLNVAQIQFSARKDQNDVNIEYNNLSVVNMLNIGSSAGNVTLPTGTYTDIELKVKLVQSSVNVPLILKGTYKEANGGAAIPVEVQFNEDFEMKQNPPQVTIKGDKYKADIKLSLNKMLTGLTSSDFGQTTRTQPNNTILVTSTINPSLYAKLKANLLTIPDVQITHE